MTPREKMQRADWCRNRLDELDALPDTERRRQERAGLVSELEYYAAVRRRRKERRSK